MAVFGSDLQRQVAVLVNPVDPVAQAGAAAHVSFGSFHRNIAGQGQVGDRAAFLRYRRSAKHEGTKNTRQKLPHKFGTRH